MAKSGHGESGTFPTAGGEAAGKAASAEGDEEDGKASMALRRQAAAMGKLHRPRGRGNTIGRERDEDENNDDDDELTANVKRRIDCGALITLL